MRHAIIAVSAAIAFLLVGLARAQTPPASSTPAPPAENLAAAHELIQAMKVTDQMKALLPIIEQSMKAAIVQNRPEVEKRYDALMPLFVQAANARMNEFSNQIAEIYAQTFSADEIRQIAAFYQTPTGQKLIASQATLARETLALGQQFGRALAADIQTRAQEELNKSGNAN
jgi:hypothetical protein